MSTFDPDPSSPTRRIGRYEVLGEIASGGMATVYLARSLGAKGFSRLVAIKRLHPHLESEEDFVQMFLDEARLAARIRHPNVVATLDVEDSEGLYIVMEYIEGVTLLTLSRAAQKVGERVPVPIAMRIALDILGGLHAAHELLDEDGQFLNLVHRDVSPQNILVGADGSSRLTDFGIAKAASRLSMTRDGQLKGKISYMAPEQTRRVELDRRVDVFTMGIVIWEVLAGRRLFSGESDVEVLNQLLFEPIPRLKDHAPSLPSTVEQAVMRALDREPAQRYRSALEFAEALEQAMRVMGGAAPHRVVAGFVQKFAGDRIARERGRITSGSPPSAADTSGAFNATDASAAYAPRARNTLPPTSTRPAAGTGGGLGPTDAQRSKMRAPTMSGATFGAAPRHTQRPPSGAPTSGRPSNPSALRAPTMAGPPTQRSTQPPSMKSTVVGVGPQPPPNPSQRPRRPSMSGIPVPSFADALSESEAVTVTLTPNVASMAPSLDDTATKRQGALPPMDEAPTLLSDGGLKAAAAAALKAIAPPAPAPMPEYNDEDETLVDSSGSRVAHAALKAALKITPTPTPAPPPSERSGPRPTTPRAITHESTPDVFAATTVAATAAPTPAPPPVAESSGPHGPPPPAYAQQPAYPQPPAYTPPPAYTQPPVQTAPPAAGVPTYPAQVAVPVVPVAPRPSRAPWIVALVAVALALAMGGVAAFLYVTRSAPNDQPQGDSPRPPIVRPRIVAPAVMPDASVAHTPTPAVHADAGAVDAFSAATDAPEPATEMDAAAVPATEEDAGRRRHRHRARPDGGTSSHRHGARDRNP